MKIVFVNARYAPEGVAGSALSTQHLAEQLVRGGHQASVVCRTQTRSGVIHEEIAGVRVVRVGLDTPPGTALEELAAAVRDGGADVIHTFFPRETPLLGIAQIASTLRVPLVHTLNSLMLVCQRGSWLRDGQACKRQCGECVEFMAARRPFVDAVNAVVGHSRYMLDLHRNCGLFRTTTVSDVIYPAYAAPATLPDVSCGTPLRLGYLGRLDPLKGIELLLETLATRLYGRDWALTVAGTGDPCCEAVLKEKYADARTRFVGFIPPEELLAAIDVLVVPSLLVEPIGRAIVEACGHGVAVLGSTRGGIPEAIEPGVTGLVFDPDIEEGVGSLADAIGRLLDDPALVRAMKAGARAKWQACFRPEIAAARYGAVYEAVAGTTG